MPRCHDRAHPAFPQDALDQVLASENLTGANACYLLWTALRHAHALLDVLRKAKGFRPSALRAVIVGVRRTFVTS